MLEDSCVLFFVGKVLESFKFISDVEFVMVVRGKEVVL